MTVNISTSQVLVGLFFSGLIFCVALSASRYVQNLLMGGHRLRLVADSIVSANGLREKLRKKKISTEIEVHSFPPAMYLPVFLLAAVVVTGMVYSFRFHPGFSLVMTVLFAAVSVYSAVLYRQRKRACAEAAARAADRAANGGMLSRRRFKKGAGLFFKTVFPIFRAL